MTMYNQIVFWLIFGWKAVCGFNFTTFTVSVLSQWSRALLALNANRRQVTIHVLLDPFEGAGGPATTVIMHSDIPFGTCMRNAFGAVMRLTYRSHCAAALQKFLFIFYMGLLCGNQSLYKQAGVKWYSSGQGASKSEKRERNPSMSN